VVIDPDVGALASRGEWGAGRLPAPARLLEICEQLLGSQASEHATWRGLRVLVSAGGTREAIDGVRYIGNRSSGQMGFALARQAARRGAEVTLVAANVALEAPPSVNLFTVSTAAELAEACKARFETTDVLLMAAAVADFRPRAAADTKLKKDQGPPQIELEPTEDVLASLAARRRPDQVLVGFAAEHGEGAIDYARDKLERKRLDAVVVNDISKRGIGFDAAENEVTIVVSGNGEHRVARARKDAVAACVLDQVEELRGKKESSDRAFRADPHRAARV
jgi:phosphopantothenoylcysteine decarboxylase/phosphopantothenate--cysteine ligase